MPHNEARRQVAQIVVHHLSQVSRAAQWIVRRRLGRRLSDGWERYEELKRAHISSRFAFFARKFENPDLDAIFDHCLRPAVQATGYELRTVTQRAGLVDAIIEDEIRRIPRTSRRCASFASGLAAMKLLIGTSPSGLSWGRYRRHFGTMGATLIRSASSTNLIDEDFARYVGDLRGA